MQVEEGTAHLGICAQIRQQLGIPSFLNKAGVLEHNMCIYPIVEQSEVAF
jgi:hypothetical protein